MSERQSRPRAPATSVDMTALTDRILSRIDDVRDDLTDRLEKIDARQTERSDRIENRILANRDAATSRETAFAQQLSAVREDVGALQEIRKDVETLRTAQVELEQKTISAAAEGAAAGSAAASAKVVVPNEVASQTVKTMAKSPWGMAILAAGGISTLAGAATVIPKIWRFLADFIPALGYFMTGGGV